jgi:glycosyltransferase involved in cell wall biosynthesis
MQILYVTPRYFPLMGGVENHVYQVARRLAQQGIHVTVLTTDLSGRLPAHEQIDGVAVQRTRAWPARRDYYLAPQIYCAILRGGWDLVHVQSYHTLVAPLAMLAAWRAAIPYVVTFHGGGHSSRLRGSLRGLQQRLLRPLLARAARLIAVARFEIDLFGETLQLPQDRFALIPNGADLPKPLHAPPVDENLLVSIGRLERYKGHHRVIEALPTVLAQRPGTRLWIAGTGPYEDELRRLARDLGVADRVEIRAIPPGERETLAVELSKAALVLLFSEYETHPIAILEALALGRPVLVADTSGLGELAARGLATAMGLESTPAQIGDAILDQLAHPHRPPPIHLPTWDECADGLLSLYEDVLRRKQCAS